MHVSQTILRLELVGQSFDWWLDCVLHHCMIHVIVMYCDLEHWAGVLHEFKFI